MYCPLRGVWDTLCTSIIYFPKKNIIYTSRSACTSGSQPLYADNTSFWSTSVTIGPSCRVSSRVSSCTKATTFMSRPSAMGYDTICWRAWVTRQVGNMDLSFSYILHSRKLVFLSTLIMLRTRLYRDFSNCVIRQPLYKFFPWNNTSIGIRASPHWFDWFVMSSSR